jgi:hypothetical protein
MAALVLVLAGVGACATTEFRSTWKDPSAQPGMLQGKRVATFVLAKSEGLRREGEQTLAQEVSSRGGLGVPGYRIIDATADTDKEVLRQKLKDADIDGAVVMRLLNARQELYVSPGVGPYGSFYGYWDYGWGAAYDPYVTTSTIVTAETLVYSVKDDKLLWSGVSETTDPTKLDKFVKEVADKASEEMAKQGLLVAAPKK